MLIVTNCCYDVSTHDKIQEIYSCNDRSVQIFLSLSTNPAVHRHSWVNSIYRCIQLRKRSYQVKDFFCKGMQAPNFDMQSEPVPSSNLHGFWLNHNRGIAREFVYFSKVRRITNRTAQRKATKSIEWKKLLKEGKVCATLRVRLCKIRCTRAVVTLE